jgi:hypothetical protein
MAKNIVFILHGIGEYDKDWLQADSTAAHQLREDAKNYGFFEGKNLDAYVEFVPVLYDDVFKRILKHWSDLGESLSNAVPVMPDAAAKALGYIQKADDDAWSIQHAGDVVLYWGFRLFQQRVVLRVLAQITRKIADSIVSNNQVPGYHILAHSLGTAVAHDALHHLGTEDWLGALAHAPFNDADGPTGANDRDVYLDGLKRLKTEFGIANPFHPSQFQFETVTMLSNVSELIHSHESPYNSIVRPGSASAESAFTKSYINVNHSYDPISIAGNFKMPKAWEMQGGVDLKVDHVLYANIHSAAHYVAHPNVHLRLLQSYVDPFFATDKDIKAVTTFQRNHGFKNLADAMLKDKIKSLIPVDGQGIDKILVAVERIGRLM